jgi:hypothetical protein
MGPPPLTVRAEQDRPGAEQGGLGERRIRVAHPRIQLGHADDQTEGGGTATANVDYVTIAYDAASGEATWTGRYDGLPGGAADNAYAVAVDSAADAGVRIFVTGSSVTGGQPPWNPEVDFTTVAYFEPWRKP